MEVPKMDGLLQSYTNASHQNQFCRKKRTNFFVTFFFLKCYIVERGKNAGGKSGQKGSCRCRISERGKTDMDNELFMKLYSAYQKELYLYLYSLCRNRHQAEDLLHETFLKALLALPDGHTNMRAWLYMVARNLFYNQQKKKSKEILTEEQNVVPEESTNGELLENILAEESRRLLYQSIQKLEVRKREIIQMQYFGGMSQKEIAVILHITPENVRVLAYRAKKELKKYLESYEMENV